MVSILLLTTYLRDHANLAPCLCICTYSHTSSLFDPRFSCSAISACALVGYSASSGHPMLSKCYPSAMGVLYWISRVKIIAAGSAIYERDG